MKRLAAALTALYLWCLSGPLRAGDFRLIAHPYDDLGVSAFAQGPGGYLWMVSRDGLHRFDGLNLTRIPGFPGGTPRSLSVGGDGAVWFTTGQGLIRYDGKFTVAHAGNLLDAAAGADSVYFIEQSRDNTGYHLFRRTRAGALQPLDVSINAHLYLDSSGTLWYSWNDGKLFRLPQGANHAEYLGAFPAAVANPSLRVYPGADGAIWGGFAAIYASFRRGEVQSFRRNSTLLDQRDDGNLVPGAENRMWLLDNPVRELVSGAAIPLPWGDSLAAPHVGIEDPRGHLWIDDRQHGFLELAPDPGWTTWPATAFGGFGAAQIVRTPAGEHYAASNGGGLSVLRDGVWKPLPAPGDRYHSLLGLPDGTLLASVRYHGLVHLDAQGKTLHAVKSPDRNIVSNYRDLFAAADGGLWVGNKLLGLSKIQVNPDGLRLDLVPLPGQQFVANVVDIEADGSGRLWVAHDLGIVWREPDGVWRQLPVAQSIDHIRSFALGPGAAPDEIWIAYRTKGRFSRLRRGTPNWTVEDFQVTDGYGPADTFFLKRDSRGWIWRGTPQGVYVSDGRHVAPGDWLRLDRANGLAGANYTQFSFTEDPDGTVWLAGEDGVTRLRPSPAWFSAPRGPLRFTRLLTRERAYLNPAEFPDRFLTAPGNLRFEAGSFDFSPFRPAPLLYRLSPIAPGWRSADRGVIAIGQLPDGDYTLEVAYNAPNPVAAAHYRFSIGPPPSLLSRILWPWGAGGAAAALLAAIALAMRRRRPVRRSSAGLAPIPLEEGQLVRDGRYRVGPKRGDGGFAVVHEAADLAKDGARVAIKAFHGDDVAAPWRKARFSQEVATLQQLRHPGLLPLLDFWIDADGRPFLVTKLLEGPTLRSVLDNSLPRPERTARLISQLADAIAAAHELGVIHRDIKPENIIVTNAGSPDEQPVLIDFGSAGWAGKNEGVARTMFLTGSPRYLAPEQLSNQYGRASDLYSLAVVALELLTGKTLADLAPSRDSSGFAVEIMSDLLDRGFTDARPVASILIPAFALDPDRRPPDIRAWSIELSNAIHTSYPAT